MVLLVLLDLMEHKEFQDMLQIRVLLDRLDLLEHKELWVLLGLLEYKE
jgi:hypothetical protein